MVMPRRVDYAARFEFLRQAAFELVRDESVEALTRRALAAELGCGLNTVLRLIDSRVDLVRLAAREVVSRRRRGRMMRRSQDPQEYVGNVVRSLMPEDDSHLDEELVWLRLLATCSFRAIGTVPRGSARREFWIAQLGYDDGTPGEPPAAPVTDGEDHRTAMQPYLDEHDAEVTQAVDLVLEMLAVPGPRDDVRTTVVAVLEGLTFSACLGRITAQTATELAITFVRSLGVVGELPLGDAHTRKAG
jgi:hypothetical protein